MRFQKRVTLPLVGWIKEILYKKESKVCLKTNKQANKQTNKRKQWKDDYDNDPDREKRLPKDQIGKLGLKGKY